MNIIEKLIGIIKLEGKLEERIVWGILVERKLHLSYKLLAYKLRVPLYVLAGHILEEWLTKNYENLMKDLAERVKFEEYLTEKYLKSE